MSDTRNQAIANFVQQLKDDGTWDLIDRTMIPGPDGPLNKSDMEVIWARQYDWDTIIRALQPVDG